jgi:hypothetical protein
MFAFQAGMKDLPRLAWNHSLNIPGFDFGCIKSLKKATN